ncbi:hypothetical protein FRB94_011845 [Tulasnella sp. JGI-2019a]|nr:hypothetical protein FRB94_011845 [Tulasnella sp. JGI-2019a]
MSYASLAGLASKFANDDMDISSTTFPDDIEIDDTKTPGSSPKRPTIAPVPRSAPNTTSNHQRHVFSRIPSEALHSSMSLSPKDTPSPAVNARMRSFLSEAADGEDSNNFSALDTPVREKRTGLLDDSIVGGAAAAREKRGRASLGGPPKGQMTLREQERVIDTVKKENFSLKFKVHMLEERLTQLSPENYQVAFNSNIKLKLELHTRGVELKKLKKLVMELESELSKVAEREKQRNAAADSEAVGRLEAQLRDRDEEVRELKKRLRAAEVAKQSGSMSMSNQPAVIRLREENEALAERQAELEDELQRNRGHLEETTEGLEKLQDIIQRQKEDADNDATRRRLRELEDHNEHLEKRLDEYEAAIQERDEDADTLKEEFERVRAQLEDSERRREADANERSVSRAEILEEREDKESLEQSANEYRDKLAAANIELEQKEDELEEMRLAQDEMEADWRANVQDLENICVDQKGQIESLEVDKQNLENTLEELHDKIEKTIQHMNHQIAEKEIEKETELRDIAEQREQETLAANTEINEQGKRIWELEEELEAERDGIERLRQEASDRSEEHARIVSALKERITDKNAQLDEIRQLYEECRQQALAHADRSQQIENDAQEMAEEIEAERAANAQAQRDLRHLEDKLDDAEQLLKKEQSRWKKELDDVERRWRRKLDDQQQSLDETRNALAAQKKLLTEREADVAKLQDTLNDLESESRKLGESHSTDRFALELETERLRRDLARAEEDLEKAKKELSMREEKAREQESMLDKLHADNRDLRTQVSAQTQARLNLSEKLDLVQENLKSKEAELADIRERYNDAEKRLSKDQRQLQAQETQYRDQLTERNTLLLTVYQYLEKILGVDKTPRKSMGSVTRPLTNFALFHEDLMSRMKALSHLTADFEKKCKVVEQRFAEKLAELKRQLDGRWKQLDKFESSVKTALENKDKWRRKYQVAQGELKTSKANNLELNAMSKRGDHVSPGEPSTSDLKAMATRVANAERRATHAQNLLLTKEEQANAQLDKYQAAEEKWAARVAEYERREKHALEKFKNERQGGKETVQALQNEIEVLKGELDRRRKQEVQLDAILEPARANAAAAAGKRPGR